MAWRGHDRRNDRHGSNRPPVWEKDIRPRSPLWDADVRSRSPLWDRDVRSRSPARERNRSRSPDRYRSNKMNERHDRETNRDLERKNREYERSRGRDRRDHSKHDRHDRRDDKYKERSQERHERRRDYDKERREREPSPIQEVEMEDAVRSPEPTGDSSKQAGIGDWICKCGALNFKRRYSCYRRGCEGTRLDGTSCSSMDDDQSSGITRRLIIKRLDALTNEESVLNALSKDVPSIVNSITGISIGRDNLTGASKGIAFVSFNNLTESMNALNTINSLANKGTPLLIDDREVKVAYCNETLPRKIGYPQKTSAETERASAAAALAQTAIAAGKSSWTPAFAPTFSTTGSTLQPVSNPPTGDGVTKFPTPNVQTFLYDDSSGYYYDPSTGLYYDGNTQYFYNSQMSQYMYWDAANMVYVLATQNKQNVDQPKFDTPGQEGQDDKKKKNESQDKVKVAKKIAKDMEKWAKTLNQKKESAKNNSVMEQPRDCGPSVGSADIGYSVLGRPNVPSLPTIVQSYSPPPKSAEEFLVKTTYDEDEGIFDWAKLTCLICKRQFPSADVLKKHRDISELHKTNLAAYRSENPEPAQNNYRDRAAERRMKYGEPSPPRPKFTRPEPVVPAITPAPAERVADGIGGRLLEKMGWSEGKGLGRSEQGRIAPIEAERRSGTAGLGQKRGIYTAAPGETYRDTVKKLAIARYNEILREES